jgi:hypothetical protein
MTGSTSSIGKEAARALSRSNLAPLWAEILPALLQHVLGLGTGIAPLHDGMAHQVETKAGGGS